jgi:hypothetical protein
MYSISFPTALRETDLMFLRLASISTLYGRITEAVSFLPFVFRLGLLHEVIIKSPISRWRNVGFKLKEVILISRPNCIKYTTYILVMQLEY